MTRSKRVLVGLSLWSAVFSMGILTHHVVIGRQLESISEDYLTQSQLDRLIVDQRLISESGVFPSTPQVHDAGPLLNPLIKLDGGSPAEQTSIVWPWWGGEAVRTATRGPRSARRAGPDQAPWLITPELMPEGDLSLMRDLLRMDHWEDAGPGGRYAEYLQTDGHPMLAESPIPNLVDLMTLARLRLARGLASPEGADMLHALQETRHLARLVYSTENLVASMVAKAILSIEDRAYRRAVERGLIAPGDWEPASDELRQAIRRVGFGSVMVAAGWTIPDDALEQLEAEGQGLFSLCAAITELSITHHSAFPAWGDWPGERGFTQLGQRASVLMQAHPECRVPVARSSLQSPDRMSMEQWLTGHSSDDSVDLVGVPYLRVHILLEVLLSGGGVRQYRQYGDTPDQDYAG
jgi:hypothetical protein